MLVAGVELLPVFGHRAAAQASGVLDLKGPEAPGGRVLTKPIRSSIPLGSGPEAESDGKDEMNCGKITKPLLELMKSSPDSQSQLAAVNCY